MTTVEQGTLALIQAATPSATAQATQPHPHSPGFALLVLAGFSVGAAFAWSEIEKRKAHHLRSLAEALENADGLLVVGE